MQHKKMPLAPASAKGLKNKYTKQLTIIDNISKSGLDTEAVNALRLRAIKKRFCLPQAQVNWLAQNAFGKVANDR